MEDNPDEAELALLGFERVNGPYDVQVVNNGEEAMDFLLACGRFSKRQPNHKPNLILLDVDLPKANGFDVLRRLRQEDAYKTTPVVMLTTSDERADLLRGYQLGANSYLCKPMDFDSFTDLLSQITQYWLGPKPDPEANSALNRAVDVSGGRRF
ncbi:response regulator [Marinimicrobium sp. ABcell2]|uniref:response regulator n=1 Tax=Marinimicrobium sp. ABcell2 TaxID=3069751 RepID=UPI0027AFBA56|nr:response regulator [Marinimicrobium sp. ABcell2]MDQ2077929.1 response regulator [Marinimicrobium sp. ABcell2]